MLQLLLKSSYSNLNTKTNNFSNINSLFKPTLHSHNFVPHKTLCIRPLYTFSNKTNDSNSSNNRCCCKCGKKGGDSNVEKEYASGEMEYKKYVGWKKFGVKLKTLVALPWERVVHGSVLTFTLRGEVSDQIKSSYSRGISLPQICDNFIKAAYDPRISGVYLHIEHLKCGWGKVEEIRRHILEFKNQVNSLWGLYLHVAKKNYLACACEELYVPPSAYIELYGLTVQASFVGGILEKAGVGAQVERIGKYKSAGDQLTRKSMSEENREMLTSLLDNIYENWLDKISEKTEKKREDIENFINEGNYKVERLKEDGWITDIKYEDECFVKKVVLTCGLPSPDGKGRSRFFEELVVLLKLWERLSLHQESRLPTVNYQRYSRVRKWTVGLSGGKDLIAVLRASGSISRVQGSFSAPRSGIVAEQFIEKIRQARESKYKAVIIRIDSPGGDALASDLMWREIKLLAASKPVIASMADVAASGGYYMAMAAGVILAEDLTLTGSIGVVTGRFNLGNLYEKIGFNKEIISRGRFAELTAAEHRPLRPDEAELFAKSAQHAYIQFRDKAAFSRSMTVDSMEEVAQGRVWTGKDAVARGLVDAIGGFSRAVAIAKQLANIPQDRQVTLVELTRSSSTLPQILSQIGNTLVGADTTLRALLQDLAESDGIQARMDGIVFQKLEGASHSNPILTLMKDYLGSI